MVIVIFEIQIIRHKQRILNQMFYYFRRLNKIILISTLVENKNHERRLLNHVCFVYYENVTCFILLAVLNNYFPDEITS